MSEQKDDPSRGSGVEAAAVTAVGTPGTPGWLSSTWWRLPAIAFLIAFIAFEAGAQFGAGNLTPATTEERSPFAASFDAAGLMPPLGLACSGGGTSAQIGGGRSYAISSSRCPVAPAQQSPAILGLERQISAAVRNNATSLDGGLSGPSNDGPTVMTWNYRSGGFDGSVYLVVDRTSTDVGVAVVLDEHVRR